MNPAQSPAEPVADPRGPEGPSPEPRQRVIAQGRADLSRLRFPELLLSVSALLIALAFATFLVRSGLRRDWFLGWGLLAACLLGLVVWSILSIRRHATFDKLVRDIVAPSEPRVAATLLRAAALEQRLRHHPEEGSLELASWHLTRVVEEMPWPKIEEALISRGRRALAIGAFLTFAAGLTLLLRSWPTLEGLDLLLSARREAPFSLPYVAQATVTATPPAYLGGNRKALTLWADSATLPQGSTVRVEVLPMRAGRDLVLTDGERETRFESDGQGKLVAELTLPETMVLKIAARFGERYILDPFDCTLFAEADQPPTVEVAGAPRTVAIADMGRLSLDYKVRDDHGIAEIQLVVESGRREERKELARPAKDTLEFRGVASLNQDHPLVRGAFLPVRVRVEARDENQAGTTSWSRSAEVTLLPRPLGQALSERYVALRSFRDRLVDYYDAERSVQLGAQAERAERLSALAGELEAQLAELEVRLRELPEKSEGAMTFLRAQVEALTRAGPRQLVPEQAILAADALLMERGNTDAKRLADDLASAVDEIAVRAKVGQREETAGLLKRELSDLIGLGRGGAQMLSNLGVLGRDLAGVAEADFGRMESSLADGAFDRVERVAVHLAARLRRGKPSFGARSESAHGSGRGSVESGAPSDGAAEAEGPASEAPAEYERLERAADRLAQDHASQLSALEHWLEEARRAARRDSSTPEERARASERLRESLNGLPEAGAMPGSARSEAAIGRAQGEAMADALEAGDAERALERGRSALGAVERAVRLAEQTGSTVSSEDLERATRGLTEAMRAAEEQRAQGQREMQGERERLRERAKAERKLADEAEGLLRRSQGAGAPLSEQSQAALRRAEQWMRKGAEALEQGAAEQGRDLLERAQAELERAVPSPAQGGSDASPGGPEGTEVEGSESQSYARDGHVPEAENGLGRAFRERVQSGLSDKRGSLGPAVSRYLERLQ